nr:zinc finger protein NUTCRACKER-like [Ipomoea trifida]
MNRRDSFLTHRAFCDALAEETARVTAAAVASDMHNAAVLGNISYHFLGTPSLGPVSMPPPASHFSSIFKPSPSSDGEGNTPMRHGGLPPWMGQAQNSVQTSDSPPVTYTDWDKLIPNKVSENADEILNSSLPLNNTKEVSVPLLFSSQLQPHQPPSTAADMLGSEVDDIPGLCHFQMYPSKRRHIQNEEGAGGGQTRDFLGVGIQSICHPSSLNGWL